MGRNCEIKIIGNVGSLNTSAGKANCMKAVVVSNSDTDYDIYFWASGTRKIICSKLNTNIFNSSSEMIMEESSTSKQSSFTDSVLCFSRVLHLPVLVYDLVSSNQALWAVGREGFFSVKLYLKSAFQHENLKQDDECMEILMEEEFQPSDFETVIKMTDIQKHNFVDDFFCIKCDLSDDSFAVCYKNSETLLWNLVLVIGAAVGNSDNLLHIPLLSFPLSYTSNSFSVDTSSIGNKNNCYKPGIIFCDANHSIWNEVFEAEQRLFSNYVCLIGHTEGKILCSLCSWFHQEHDFKLTTQLQQLYDIKQPIIGAHYVESIGKLIGSGFLIVVGEKGKLILISSKQLCKEADSLVLTNGSLWVMTSQLPSPVQNQIFLNDCLIHLTSKGDIWVTKFIPDDNVKSDGKRYLKLTTEATNYREIVNIFIVNKTKGLFVMITKAGSLYLMQCSDTTSEVAIHGSLPSLMNGVLQQSVLLKNLLSIKHLQNKFFAAVSTFAAIKFRDGNKIQVDCAMTEIEGPPKKLLLDLNFKNYEHLNLDPDFWFVTASLYSHFQEDTAIISKSKPLGSGQNLCIEILETYICPSYSSPFPLYLEVGLILDLPENLKTTDCFKQIIKKLPSYVRTHTFILNELYLLKNKSKTIRCQKFTSDTKFKTVLQKMTDMNVKNPVFRMLKDNHREDFTVCKEYTLCLLDSSAEDMVQHFNKESDLVHRVFQLLGRRSSWQHITQENQLLCQNQPISLSVSYRDNIIYVTVAAQSAVLLLGLRMALTELLLSSQNKSSCEASNCVSTPANILRQCEELSKELSSMYGTDVNKSDFLKNALKVYRKLRKEVSEKLPF